MECGRERTSAGERKAAGEGFLKGREQIDVGVPFFNSSVKREGVRKHQQDIAAGKRTNSF